MRSTTASAAASAAWPHTWGWIARRSCCSRFVPARRAVSRLAAVPRWRRRRGPPRWTGVFRAMSGTDVRMCRMPRRCPTGPNASVWRAGDPLLPARPMWSAGNDVGFLVSIASASARTGRTTISPWCAWRGNLRDRDRAQAQLGRTGRARGRLHDAQRMQAIGTLAGGIAHEFNNILGAILGDCEMAIAARARPIRRAALVEQAMKAGQRAAT